MARSSTRAVRICVATGIISYGVSMHSLVYNFSVTLRMVSYLITAVEQPDPDGGHNFRFGRGMT